MPIRRTVNSDKNLLRTTITGPVALEELVAHLNSVHAMQGAAMGELIDTRGATPSFGAKDLTKLAEHGRQLFANGPMAPRAVVVSGVIHFGIARLFAALVAPWVRVSVFDDLTAAEAWIDMMILAGT